MENGEKYIVTEYLHKGSLLNLLKSKKAKLTLSDLLTMYSNLSIALTKRCIGAAKGLAYLESKNILHRDVALRFVGVHNVNVKGTYWQPK